jgi:hypothetical protein
MVVDCYNCWLDIWFPFYGVIYIINAYNKHLHLYREFLCFVGGSSSSASFFCFSASICSFFVFGLQQYLFLSIWSLLLA